MKLTNITRNDIKKGAKVRTNLSRKLLTVTEEQFPMIQMFRVRLSDIGHLVSKNTFKAVEERSIPKSEHEEVKEPKVFYPTLNNVLYVIPAPKKKRKSKKKEGK